MDDKQKILDATGWECPKPIIETKKILNTMAEGTILTIVDNQIAVDNLTSFALGAGYGVTCEEKDTLFHVNITKDLNSSNMANTAQDNLVIAITSNFFGVGSEELGENLMKAYIYALTEVSKKPKTLIFVNGGVFLTTEGSEVLDSLSLLESQGVEIMSCGACLNYYGLTESVAIGSISNMYSIADKMNNGTNTIKI
jgi:selenium metabolism protein YedF